MNSDPSESAQIEQRRRRARDAVWAAALFALDPAGLGGVLLRGPSGPVRDAWCALMEDLADPETPRRRVPIGASAERLAGGVDLAASLAAGRAVEAPGLIAEAVGGWLILPSAERRAVEDLAPILTALAEQRQVGVLAFDEAQGADDSHPPAALTERLSLWVDLQGLRPEDLAEAALTDEALAWEQLGAAEMSAARARMRETSCPEPVLTALVETAAALGVGSLRAAVAAARAARALTALMGPAPGHSSDSAALAARLILAPRAVYAPAISDVDPIDASDHHETSPAADQGEDASRPPLDAGPDSPEQTSEETPSPHDLTDAALAELVLSAAAAALPPDMLTARAPDRGQRRGAASAGVAGARRRSLRRGRPLGSRPGDPRAGGRLDLVETLRAAVPWAEIRRRAACAEGRAVDPLRPPIRRADLRIKRFAQPSETLTIFAVDASGSAAFHRLAEAKGAVELLLSRAYARRDQVAVIAFRRRPSSNLPPAELLLPPTRALARAKRELAALPGGGATPLADGLQAAADLAETALRRNVAPTLAILTDGRANIALDGRADRRQATEDALAAARRLAAMDLRACVIDTSPRPRDDARALALAMAARYEPLPYSCAEALTDAVRTARAP